MQGAEDAEAVEAVSPHRLQCATKHCVTSPRPRAQARAPSKPLPRMSPWRALAMLAAVARGLRPSARPSFRRGRTITMGLKTGIVGLPNVGKSTLFNALTEDVNAEAANYPFCTIEPNVGVVSVPDARLSAFSDIHDSEKTVATSLEFVDIAAWSRARPRARAWGTSSSRTSASATRSCTSSAASTTRT